MGNESDNNKVWKKQKQALEKAQLSFTLIPEVDRLVRIQAAKDGMLPSGVIRKILGMESSQMNRPRVGVSFKPEELDALAKRFDVDPNNRVSILKRATEVVQLHFRDKIDK